jgi:hypothetical protein
MSWIKTVDEQQASGLLKEIYKGFTGANGVPNVIKVHSLHPEVLRDHVALYKTIMFDHPDLVVPNVKQSQRSFLN